MKRWAAAVVMLGAAGLVHADEPVDWDDVRAAEEGFWGRVAHPQRVKYRDLVQSGRQLLGSGNIVEAEKRLEEAVALEPDQPDARYYLGELYGVQNRWTECADEYAAIAAADPDWTPPDGGKGPAWIAFRAGFCLSLDGRLDDAIPQFRRVIALGYQGLPEPQQPGWTHWNLGDVYHALGRLDEAVEEYERGLQLLPNEAMLWLALGVAWDRDEQVTRARDAIERGVQLGGIARAADPNVLYIPPADEHYYLGLSFKVDAQERGLPGWRVRAIAHFRRYVATSDGSPWLERAREHLRELGPTAVGEQELEVRPADAAEKAALKKALLGGAPAMQTCLTDHPYGVVVAQVTLAPPSATAKKDTPPPKPVVTVHSHGPVEVDSKGTACVTEKIVALKLPVPKKGFVTAALHLIAR